MIVVELYERDNRIPIIEVHLPVEYFDLPDVIEYKGHIFVRVYDHSMAPRYVKGTLYHAS